ncbi:response regulator transcription factor [Pedobacter ureilyticus]|uniref:Response regulator transcription factor n=1 Tax=Pedobacter ureilyticus TaxID=1393051 RepID=A0ABW9J2W5_9SPHI|nr:LuxR C-terminal-related transcriptional regulator [Pedobacter helvus]
MKGQLHLIDHSQKLPGGTIDKSVEFFVHDGEMFCRTEGETHKFDDFPQWVIDIVQKDMDKHPEKIGYLVEWGLLTQDGQMRQYLFCLYGGHDDNPDIDENGIVQQSEYVDCGLRCGKCDYEGKICNSLQLQHGRLSSQEIKTLILIGNNALDKEIADELFVSEGTIRYYKNEIMRKAGMANERKTALVGLAFKLGLVK